MNSAEVDIRLKDVMETLLYLHKHEGLQFLLATKDKRSHSRLKVLHSRIVNDHKRQQIINVIKNRAITLTPPMSEGLPEQGFWQIRPALVTLEIIEVSRLKKGDFSLNLQYDKLFSALTQSVCKIVAKEWIKFIEPRKQATHPYKFGDDSRPPWWPAKVKHTEPDHMDKDGRVKLLTMIIRNPEFDLGKLYEKTKVLTFPSKAFTRVLDEIYYLAAHDRVFFHEESCEAQIRLFKHFLDEETATLSRVSFGIRVSGPGVPMASKITLTNESAYSLFECSLSAKPIASYKLPSTEPDTRTRSKICKKKTVNSPKYVAPIVKLEDDEDLHHKLTGSLSFGGAEPSSDIDDEMSSHEDPDHLSSFESSY